MPAVLVMEVRSRLIAAIRSLLSYMSSDLIRYEFKKLDGTQTMTGRRCSEAVACTPFRLPAAPAKSGKRHNDASLNLLMQQATSHD